VRSCRHPAAETGHLLTAFTGQCCWGAFRPADGRPPPAATARAGARSGGCPGAGGLSGSPAGHDEHATGARRYWTRPPARPSAPTSPSRCPPAPAPRNCAPSPQAKRRPRWQTGADVPVLPHMRVWRSVRAGGKTKTRSSRRTLALPHRAIVALREQHDRQRAGAGWAAHDLVFAPRTAPPSTLPTSDAASATPPPAWTRCLDAPPAAAQLRLAAARRRRPDRTDRPPDRPRRRIEGHRRRLPQTAATGHRRGRDSHEPRLPGRPWP
jgi:hypothetical protein